MAVQEKVVAGEEVDREQFEEFLIEFKCCT